MRILIATSTVTPNAGIPSFNRELCNLLNDNNDIDLLVDEAIDSYPGYGNVFSTNNCQSYRQVKTLLHTINAKGYDIIINSNSHFLAIITPFIKNKSRIITVSHSLGTLDCDNAAFNHRYIDSVIALSENCRKYLTRRFRLLSKEKIRVVFNSVANADNASELRKIKKESDTISIVFAGGTAPSKNPELVYQIIRMLCATDLPFEFYWLGNTTPPLKIVQPFKDIRQILPDDNRIKILGRIPQSQAAEIIAKCNVFLAPSRREGFPMALLEAMRVGCIPIVSDYNIANKEIIEDGKNGYVLSHKDVTSFVELLKDIIINHQSYSRIYDNSYNTFIDRLSFKVWRENIKSVCSDGEPSHKQRKNNFTRTGYLRQKLAFGFLDRYNLIENQLMEVLPSAIKFYKFFKSYK